MQKKVIDKTVIGDVYLDEKCLLSSNRALFEDSKGDFTKNVLELLNLIEVLCLKSKIYVASEAENFEFGKSEIISTFLDEEDVLCPFSFEGKAIQPLDLLRDHNRYKLITEAKVLAREFEEGLKDRMFINVDTGEFVPYNEAVGKTVTIAKEYSDRFKHVRGIQNGLMAEECFGLPYIPSIENSRMYIESLGLGITTKLFAEWENVYYKMTKELMNAKKARRGLSHNVYIPPISFYILSKSKSLSEVIPRTLELRSKLEPFRKEFVELWEMESNPEISDRDFYKKKKNLLKIGEKLISNINSIGIQQPETRIATSAADIMDVMDSSTIDELIKVGTNDISIKGIINLVTKYPLKWTWEKFHTRKFRTLFQVSKHFSKSKDYSMQINRLWNKELDTDGLLNLKSYSRITENLLLIEK